MAMRMYISDIVGDGQSPQTAYKTRFQELAQAFFSTDGVTGVLRYDVGFDAFKIGFGIGVADMDEATHEIFVADPAIRYVPKTFLNTIRADLTPEQLALITDILQRYGYAAQANAIFTDQATVKDLIFWMNGRRNWSGWNAWDAEAVD